MVENWQRQCWRILLHLSLYFVFPCIWGEIGKVWATTKPQRATSDPTCCLVLAARWTWQVCFGSSQETNVVQVGWINFIQVGNDINSLPSKTSTFKIATKTFFVMFFPKWKDIVYGWSMLNHVDPQFSRFFAFFLSPGLERRESSKVSSVAQGAVRPEGCHPGGTSLVCILCVAICYILIIVTTY